MSVPPAMTVPVDGPSQTSAVARLRHLLRSRFSLSLCLDAVRRAARQDVGAPSLTTLRWVTVAMPLVFLTAVDYLRHFVMPDLLLPWYGFVVVLSLVAISVYMFSGAVFNAFGSMERHILEQNHELAAIGATAGRQAAQLRALHEAGLALSGDLELETVLLKVVDLARDLAGARYGALAILDDQGGIRQFLTSGLGAEDRDRLQHLPVGRGLLQAVAAEKGPIRVGRLQADPRSAGFPAAHPAMTSFLGVPIMAQGRPLGSLYLTDKESAAGTIPFTAEDEELLQLFAAQAGGALANARLYEEVQGLVALAERERLARELHDSLAQVLGYVGVQAQAIQDSLRASQVAEASAGLGQLRAVAHEASADVREAIMGLRCRVGPDRDLLGVLREYLERYRAQSQVAAEMVLAPGAVEARLAPAAEVQLLRIIQEALANVRKHANAQRAWVRLEPRVRQGITGSMRVTIEDNGRGFSPEAAEASEGHFGLLTMRERAESVAGRLWIESSPGRGTRVVVDLPATYQPAAPVEADGNGVDV